jgi:hypothetical protein
MSIIPWWRKLQVRLWRALSVRAFVAYERAVGIGRKKIILVVDFEYPGALGRARMVTRYHDGYSADDDVYGGL